ncbi:hypothetical protein D6853_10085 [Butyrivibrio sp. X503]|uniref:hypothetical protein n=1 Tax=Butyrivibrio sp. X503 TaxID=2364878 RepID=UPI000EA9E531|nr:hypothetical protein [Butyrivibrio sp. X503]RKM55886.1 hypothetical protein D6853_10085 [Butyrivibrio sp. X503]
MKRRGLTLFAGLASAGVLALTGIVGAQAPANTETTETVEYKVKENASSLSECGDSGRIGIASGCKTFDEEIARSCFGDRYAYIYLKGYDGLVLMITQDGSNGSTINGITFPNTLELKEAGNDIYEAHFYTQGKDGVTLAGYLKTDGNHPLRIKDGVIYACNYDSYETYILSSDGKELVHKDYVNDDLWGYTNDTNKEENRIEFTGGQKEYHELRDNYYRASEIDLTMKEMPREANDSSLSLCGNWKSIGTLSFYTDFQNCIDNLDSQRCNYAKVKVGNYDGDVLAVQPKNEPRCVYFFTKKDGENVRVAGFLYTDGTHPVKIKDGVIYACNENSFETYLITPDGKELVHKDYVNKSNWGYTNDSSDQSKRVDYTGKFNDSKLWDAYNSASEISFNLTAWK